MDGISFENSKDQFYSVLNSNESQNSQISNQSNVSVFGMRCDGADVIAKNITVPTDMYVGDWLRMQGMRSYTVGPKSAFNGMKSTTRVYQRSGLLEQQNQSSPSISIKQLIYYIYKQDVSIQFKMNLI